LCVCETSSCYAAQAGLELLPPPSECQKVWLVTIFYHYCGFQSYVLGWPGKGTDLK
jgi:hypothetical protein